jgi:putative tricarboxylic transport membrane protein
VVRIRSQQDLFAGLLFIAFGALGLYLAANYPFGTATRMGPGYLPKVLCWMLIGLGAVIGGKALVIEGPAIEPGKWRPNIIVLLSILIFSQAIERLGLGVTAVLIVLVATFASTESKPWQSVVLALALAAFSVGTFIFGLGLSMPLWIR